MFDSDRAGRTSAGMRDFYAGRTPPMDPLALFRRMAAGVPAYRDFLREHGVDPAAVGSVAEVPLTTKINYHQRYALPPRNSARRSVKRKIATCLVP